MLMLRARYADGLSRERIFCVGSVAAAEAAYREALANRNEWLDSLMLLLLDGAGQVLCVHDNCKWINPELLAMKGRDLKAEALAREGRATVEAMKAVR